jgi:hypothetical protein
LPSKKCWKKEQKNIVLQKLNVGSKNAELHADSVEKVRKKSKQKIFQQNVKMYFFTFSHGHQIGLLLTLFRHIF